jgi:hypothetical protein
MTVSTFKYLHTLVLEADQIQINALEVEHQQVINKVGYCGNLCLSFVTGLSSERNSLKRLFGDQFGVLFIKEPLG